MNADDLIKNRLDELIRMGESVLATRRSSPPGVMSGDMVDSQLAYQWATSVQNLLVRVFDQDSEHYRNFTDQVSERLVFSNANKAQGVLKAAQDDFENGQLFEIRRLVEAELFDEFLEQAEHLLNTGYFQTAAVVAGCVLEDGLRKLCNKSGITIPTKPKL